MLHDATTTATIPDEDLSAESEGVNRRELLAKGAVALGAVAFGGGTLWQRRTDKCRALETQLLATAATTMDARAENELHVLPAEAAERIRQYFLALCLDTHLFTSEVCSWRFRESLAGCASSPEQEQLVLAAFERHVANRDAIMRRVEAIATDIGRTLDQNWRQACDQVATDWNVQLDKEGGTLHRDGLLARLEPLIRSSIRENVATAQAGSTGPALTEVTFSIGKSAVLLLPVLRTLPGVGFPLFVLLAVGSLAPYLVGWLLRPDVEDLQEAVSSRLVELCHEIAQRLQVELQERIAALQQWQAQALRTVAHEHAATVVGWM